MELIVESTPASRRSVAAAGSGPPRPIEDLLALVAAGNQDAFKDLYTRTAWKVLGVTRAVLRDVSHAEEVSQEVFLEIWRRAGSFDRAKGSGMAWVMMLAHSRAVDRVRASQASRRTEGAYAKVSFVPDIDLVLDVVMRNAEHRQLHASLAGLSRIQREALSLTFLAGLSYPEASGVLGIPLPTLKSRVRGGLLALRNARNVAA